MTRPRRTLQKELEATARDFLWWYWDKGLLEEPQAERNLIARIRRIFAKRRNRRKP